MRILQKLLTTRAKKLQIRDIHKRNEETIAERLKPNSLNNHKVFFTKNLKGKQNILNGRISVEIEPAFYRPVKANFLVGDPSKMKIISDGEDKTAGKFHIYCPKNRL